MKFDQSRHSESSFYSARVYLKASAVFAATTASYFLAKTAGILPNWLSWSNSDQDKALTVTDKTEIAVSESYTSVLDSSFLPESASAGLVEFSESDLSSTEDVIEIDTAQLRSTQQNSTRRKLLMTPQSAEFVVNSYTTGDQSIPAVAASSNGSFMITWTSNGQDASGNGVYGQGYNSLAVRVGSEFRVNTYTASDQSGVAISIAQNGNAYIAWGSNQDTNSIAMTNPCTVNTLCSFTASAGCTYQHRYYQDLSSCTLVASGTGFGSAGAGVPYSLDMNQLSFGVYYNRFSNNIALAAESQVNTQGINNQQNPSIATLQNGDILIVWESSGSLSYSKACTGSCNYYYPCNSGTFTSKTATDTFTGVTTPQDGSGFGIFARRFSPFGNYGPDFQINTFITGDQRLPVVSAYNDGGSVIVWQSQAQDSSGWGIFGRRVSSTGAILGNEFSVNSYVSGDQINPAVATTFNNQFVVVWQSAVQDSSGYGIYGRLFDASANPGAEFRVNTFTLNDQINPAVATFSTGEFIVVWQSAAQDSSGYGIYGQRFSAEALPFGSEFLLNTYTSGDQADPAIATFIDGGFVATWDSASQDGSGKAVVARVYKNNQLPSLKMGQLTITEGGAITITPLILNITGDHPVTQLMLAIGNLQHGQFQISPQNNSVLQFSEQDILSGQVQFAHNGDEFAPNFTLTASDGFFTLNAVAPNISYIPVNDPPSIIVNKLTITQGQTVYFNASNLQAIDPDSPLGNLTFSITGLQYGVFKSISQGNISVNKFRQSNITAGDIFFVQDGSASPPYYQVTVDDGEFFVGPQTVAIGFGGLALVNNYLSIAEGQSVTLTTNNLNAVATATPANQIFLIASAVEHGQFERIAYPGVVVSSFNLQEIQFNSIRFLHDDSEYAPSFNIAVSDGVTTINPRSAVISYTPVNNFPILVNNSLTLIEDEAVILTASDLSATDRDNSADSLIFIVHNILRGHFEMVSSSGVPVTSFLQSQITAGNIRFVDEGSNSGPSYQISVSDGLLTTLPGAAQISFTPVDDAPVIVINQLSLQERGSTVLTSSQLLALDVDNSSTELTFTVSAAEHGHFERVFTPGTELLTFTQQDIDFSFIRFVHDGSELAPSYDLIVSDSILIDGPKTALMTYTPINDPPILIQNELTITEGGSVIINATYLNATDPDNLAADLIFLVTDLQYGHFYSTRNVGAVTTFLQRNISSGEIFFAHNHPEQQAPQYFIAVSDGQLVTIPQAATIRFTPVNDRPILINNGLTIDQGGSIILSSNDLSAEDEETPADELVFRVSDIFHGQFEYVFVPGEAITIFSQSKIKTADVRFVDDDSDLAPAYKISVSDGELMDGPKSGLINFNKSPEGLLAGKSDTVKNAIIGASVSGGFGLLFLAIRLLISYYVSKRLEAALDTPEDQKRVEFNKNVVRPIAKKIFDGIKTTSVMNYRSEETTQAYLRAITHLVTRLEESGVDLEMKNMSPSKQLHLFNEIVRHTREILVPPVRCCSLAYTKSFFRPEATPVQLQSKAEDIAQAVGQSLAGSGKNQSNSQAEHIEMSELPDPSASPREGRGFESGIFGHEAVALRQQMAAMNERVALLESRLSSSS